MAMTEDAATVLEDWVQTVANLPAEIQHVLEEIQAKDRVAQDHRSKISTYDVGLQKHVKANGCGQANPKEDAACKAVSALYEKTHVLQEEKVGLSERAATLLDRQIKRLDIKIRDLQNDGSIQPDPQLPSLLINNSLHRLPLLSGTPTGSSTPLQTALNNASGSSTNVANAPIQRVLQQPQSHRQPSPLATNAVHSANLNAVRQNARSPSVDNPKRRRLNNSHLNIPATSSGLRQSSLGPGTPRTGMDGASRGSSAGPRPSKKAGTGRGAAVPQRVNHLNPTSGNKKPGPAARRRARQKSGTPASTRDDDVSANGSEDAEGDEDVEMEDRDREGEGEEGEDEEGDADDRKYCTCRSVSYGNMVACDNDNCPYEWFHWSCVGITSEPKGAWFCSECKPKKGRGH